MMGASDHDGVALLAVCRVMAAYTGFSYRVFRGKIIELHHA